MSDLSSGFTKPKFPIGSPLILLALVLVVLCVLLSLPLIIPIGPMYWDTYIYLDAAQRIKLGQIPAVDFLAPVGVLEYYQFYWLQTLFPGGQPTIKHILFEQLESAFPHKISGNKCAVQVNDQIDCIAIRTRIHHKQALKSCTVARHSRSISLFSCRRC